MGLNKGICERQLPLWCQFYFLDKKCFPPFIPLNCNAARSYLCTWDHWKPTSPLILNSRGCLISSDKMSQRISLQEAMEQSCGRWKDTPRINPKETLLCTNPLQGSIQHPENISVHYIFCKTCFLPLWLRRCFQLSLFRVILPPWSSNQYILVGILSSQQPHGVT